MTFGIGNEVNHIGELGLGFRDPGMTYSNSTLNQLSFLQQLVKKGDIQRNAYSFQLGINNVSEGTLLLGAVDHSKYEGKLRKVKMVDLYKDSSDSISILLDGISGTDFSMELNMAVDIRIEEATPILPDRFFDKLIAHLNAIKTPDDVTVVPCSMLNSTDSLSFYFSGIEIQVPLRDLIFQEITFGCCLTIDDYDGPYHLGQDILKSAYVVVDLDNKEVALAQATNSSSEDIEDIVSEIPQASEAPLYSYTEVAEKYYYSDGWVSSSYDVSSRPSYSTNTGSRSVDLGSTTYMPFYTKATTIYDYFASQRNSGHFTRCSPFSFLLFSILLAL